MKYIAIKGEHRNEYLDVATYRTYLKEVQDRFPPNAWEYASAPWHYDYSDPRSIHDAHVGAVNVVEPRGHQASGGPYLDISVQMVGGDREIKLSYSHVRRYSFSFEVDRDPEFPRGHGDWLLDEVTVTDEGCALHEIHFERAIWEIECEDFTYSFKSLAPVGSHGERTR